MYQSPNSSEPEQIYGDKAYEYVRISRGHYSAWIYVVVAFILQIFLWGMGPYLVLHILSKEYEIADIMIDISFYGGIFAGFLVALYTFWDRWKCVEAFSSKFCSGVVNLSLIYVPIVALVYANYRLIRKLMKT